MTRARLTSYRLGVDDATLLEAVDRAFAVTGRDTPPWPDPHPDRAAPAEEEYSRLLDPGKYLILAARAEAWAQALTGTGLAVRHDPPVADVRWEPAQGDGPVPPLHEPTRAIRLDPQQPGAWPLLLCLGAIQGVADGVVAVGVDDPVRRLASLPDCGCDACDDGSESLLQVLDEWLVGVVTGGVVLGPGVVACRTRGMSWTGGIDAASLEVTVQAVLAGDDIPGYSAGAAWG